VIPRERPRALDPAHLPRLLGPSRLRLYVEHVVDDEGSCHTHHTVTVSSPLGGVLEQHQWCSCRFDRRR
jgi:hypothetical protein